MTAEKRILQPCAVDVDAVPDCLSSNRRKERPSVVQSGSKPMYHDRSSYFAEDDVGREGFYAIAPSQRSQIRSGRSAMTDAGQRARSTDLALQLR